MKAFQWPPPPWAQLVIACSPLSLILVAYAAATWISAPLGRGAAGAVNRVGAPLHVAGPAVADRLVFGGLPSVWLQARLYDGTPHWYDAVAAVVYVSHFVAIPVLTGILWFRYRARFAGWLTTLLAFVVLGMLGYVGYPAAPPWLAAEHGVIGPVHRISGLGWSYLHLPLVDRLVGSGQSDGNPVAAMPSLHAGAALLVAGFAWPLVGRAGRAVLAGYVVLMGLVLVYTGEHYVVDVLAGWAVAGVALVLGRVTTAGAAPAAPGAPEPGRAPPRPRR